MNDFLEFFLMFMQGLLFTIFIIMVLLIPINYVSSIGCKASYSAYSPEYTFMSGCRIMYDGKLTPVGMIKNINLNK